MLTTHPSFSNRAVRTKSETVLSVVVPTFNEEGNVDALFSRLIPVMENLDVSFEIIIVDDGSADQTALRVAAWHEKDNRIKLVRFSRNFGKEAALNAGLSHARGEAVIQIDADLQHPPELLEEFFTQWRAGNDIVYGQRTSRAEESFLRRLCAKSFYRVFATVSNVKLMEGLGDFLLLDRKVVEALLALPERERFTKGLYAWVGFKRVGIPFEVATREAGNSGFNFLKLMRFAMDAITSFGSLPLKMWSLIGVGLAGVALLYGMVIIFQRLWFGEDVPGYASLMVAICFFSGIQLISLGIVGEYLSRVLTEVKQRPLYLVQERVGFQDVAADMNAAATETGTDSPRIATIV